MELFKPDSRIEFMQRRRLAMIISAVVIAAALAGLLLRGLNFGIDFTGGVLVEVGYPQAADLSEVRSRLAEAGYQGAQVQHFGTAHDVLIRLAPSQGADSETISERILEVLRDGGRQVQMRRVEFVGPQVGQELANQGGIAVLFALVGILAYVAVRFEFRFALGSVAALIHDVIVVLGLFAWLQITFDLSVLAAVLAVIGYSLNDTIVVFDRIRENFIALRKAEPISVMNISINETLSRTVITGVTTLLVLLALYFLGGEVIEPFSIALIAGIVVGTYSSIYIASAVALALGVSKQDLMPPPKDDKPAEQV